MPPQKKRILLAAGGTGGHILPAVALAEALRTLRPDIEPQFICGNRPIELQIYQRLGIEPWVLPVPYNRPGLVNRARFVARMIAAFRQSRRYLKRAPVRAAVGFGSYVSVTPLLAARLGGAKILLHEQNAYPGAANRLLARFASVIATGTDVPKGRFPAGRTHTVGNPVRPAFTEPIDKNAARAYFRLRPERLVCCCVGGSQGAVGLNNMLSSLLPRLADHEDPLGRWQLLWSTGPGHYQGVMQTIERMGIDSREHSINPFIEEMAKAYAAADVVVARAGALTLAELTAVGRASVLIPLPAAGGHQAHNARQLVQAGAAEMIEEKDPQGSAKLEAMLSRWAEAPEALAAMAEAAGRLGHPDAALKLAQLVAEQVPE